MMCTYEAPNMQNLNIPRHWTEHRIWKAQVMKFIGIQQLILRSFQQSRSSQNVPKQHNQKEEGTPKSDPELMKLKNSNMERSDLLCPVKKVHIQFMGRKTLTVLKWHQTSIVKVVHFPEPSSCILRHYKTLHLTFFCVVSGIFPLSHFFSAFCAHFPRGYHTRLCIVIIISPSSRRDSEAKGASRCLSKRVGKGNRKRPTLGDLGAVLLFWFFAPTELPPISLPWRPALVCPILSLGERWLEWQPNRGAALLSFEWQWDPILLHEVVNWSLKAPRALGPSTPVKMMSYLYVDLQKILKGLYPWHRSTWKRGVGSLFYFQAGC